MKPLHFARAVLLCATLPPFASAMAAAAETQPPVNRVAPQPPAAWQAPLPPDSQPGDLADAWQRFDDPLLMMLIQQAQEASASLATAAARIERSRAARVAAGAALLPTLDAAASGSRADTGGGVPLTSRGSADLIAGWELDLFGGNRAGRDAAQARLEGTVAQRDAVAVSVAAETALAYVAYRACEGQLALARADTLSREQTDKLTQLSAQVGFTAPADAALARASAAQGRSLEAQRRSQCDSLLKALVEITAAYETTLRAALQPAAGVLPQPAPFTVDALPARLLAQRPDVFEAGRLVLAAAGDQAQSEARQKPQISLSGSIGVLGLRIGGASTSGSTWSVGPLQVSLPIFDGGSRAADTAASRAEYTEAVSLYQAQLRRAVREVEQALVDLQGTAARADDVRIAAEGFDAALVAAEARWQGGLGSLLDLEVARRAAVSANSVRVDLQRERIEAWVALYRALGGGWTEASVLAAAGPAP
jgi:NodT family efflux transporter outer membrane factor (OMF) lipoprotein